MGDQVREPIRSASEEITSEFQTLVDSQDLDSIKQSQNLILGRLQDSNAVLSHFNDYSENCFADVSADFAKNTRLLRTMKSDLDYIFRNNGGTGERADTISIRRNYDKISNPSRFSGFGFYQAITEPHDSNAVLSHFNDYSENCFADVSADFSKNTRLLRTMKSDLDYIFQKLRSMKGNIVATYPVAFPYNSTIDALDQRPDLELAK